MTAGTVRRWADLTDAQRACVARLTAPVDRGELAAHVAGCVFCQALAATARRAQLRPLARAG